MPLTVIQPASRGFGETARRDAWWVTPLTIFSALTAFIVYTTWAAFQNKNYFWGPYLSPFYSPALWGDFPGAWFGPKPAWYPSVLPFSPAFFILVFPGGFRFTCYYYRGAYYKAFWADPPSCTVGEPRKSYWGEQSFPLLMQNIHRYFMYAAVAFIFFLSWDVWHALWWEDAATGTTRFGMGLGTLVLAVNVVLLGGYTFGCHSLRHLIGGGRDSISKNNLQFQAYNCVSCLNRKHMAWAYMSLFWVAFSDIYIRMVASGHWTDWRIF
jgi:hypothetical protein